MHWFDPEGGVEPFLPDRFPLFVWEPEDGNIFYGIPAHEGPEGGVKAAFHRVDGSECTPETLDRVVGEAEVEAIRGYLARRVPRLAGRCLRSAACMYTNTPDLHFVLSAHPGHPQVAVAAGFSGHGYKFCSVAGEILADLATQGSTRHPIGLFSPERFQWTS